MQTTGAESCEGERKALGKGIIEKQIGFTMRNPAILIIDDDPNNLAIVASYLNDLNPRILVAEDGETGLKRACYALPDLILLDIIMPGMDGYQTCRRLKAMESTKGIPVIFMTALSETEHKIEGFEAGAVDYITKPFQREEVLARVGVHLGIGELTRKLQEERDLLEKRVKERVEELARINRELQAENIERKQAQEALRRAHEELEMRVAERTEELSNMNKALELSNQALSEFASIASHDLQEPLRKIVAFGDRLMAGFSSVLGEQGMDYLKRMQTAADRMQGLIRTLLSYSRVTTKVEPFTPVNLKGLVEGILTDLEVLISETGGLIEVGDLPTINADIHQMRQLFQNLIGNALKYHHSERRPCINIRTISTDDTFIRIAVEDNGIGFDEKYLDRIFAPFQRLHGRGEYAGTGMGLAICKKIVERHNGTITAKSSPGKGATFIVSLPRALVCQ